MPEKKNMRSGVRNGSIAMALLFVLTACDEPQIRTYRVARERAPQRMADDHAGHAHEAPAERPRPRPKLTWTLPAGWREAATNQVNLAAFSIQGESGRDAQVSIAVLPFVGGMEGEIVNLWRGTLGLERLESAEARQQLRDFEVNGEPAKLFEVSSGEGTNLQKVVTLMIHRSPASWFYKLQGDASIVDAQRSTFLDFIKTVRVDESASAAAVSPEAPATPDAFLKAAPADWKALPAGRMQLAKFSIPAVQGATGQVSVSVFDDETGGTLWNVNRWRREIGLGELPDGQLSKVAVPLDPKLPGAILVNMTNNAQQLVSAIVPRGSLWFFYKLVGNAPAVSAQREAFVRFAAVNPKDE